MIGWVRTTLYGRERWQFPAHDPVDVAVQRLAARVERWPRSWKSFTREHLVGRVSRDKVYIRRYPGWELSPAFSGRFEILRGQTALVGTYGLDWLQLLFGTAILGGNVMLLFLTGLLTVVPDLPRHVVLAIFAVGLLLCSCLLQRIGQPDRAYLAKAIRDGLTSDHDSHAIPERRL